MFKLYIVIFLYFFVQSSFAEITLISRGIDGTAAGTCSVTGMSADGGKIVFSSLSGNLVRDDNNYTPWGDGGAFGNDIFLYMAENNSIQRISVRPDGSELELTNSSAPVITNDGNYIAFSSTSPDLVPSVTASVTQFYPEDRRGNIFLIDLAANEYTWVSKTPDLYESQSSTHPSINSNGNFITFISQAANLISESSEGYLDSHTIYQWERSTNLIRVVSDSPSGEFLELGERYDVQFDVSNDGNLIAFRSKDMSLSPDGVVQIALKNLENNELKVISAAPDGTLANRTCYAPLISADQRYILFTSGADNLTETDPHPIENDSNNFGYDVFIYDIETQTSSVVPIEGGAFVQARGISADNRYILFQSGTSFGRYDREMGESRWLYSASVLLNTYRNNLTLGRMFLTADGNSVIFTTNEDQIVSEDENSSEDIYMLSIEPESKTQHWQLMN